MFHESHALSSVRPTFSNSKSNFSPPKPSEDVIPNEPESYRPPAELYPYLTNVGEIYEGEKTSFSFFFSFKEELLISTGLKAWTSYTFSDHRWTFHSERVQPSDFENSPVNHLTELQAVSPQQLIQPYRYSSESLPLHLDPPLAPLSVSPQVSPHVEVNNGTSISTWCLIYW